jgi:hypothetical protein
VRASIHEKLDGFATTRRNSARTRSVLFE